jgi:hypothetical protein
MFLFICTIAAVFFMFGDWYGYTQRLPKRNWDLIQRLRTRAHIRRNITTRKSVQEGKPDKIADLLDEAADELMKETK